MRKSEINPIEFETKKGRERTVLGVEFYCFVRLAAALALFAVGLFFRTGTMVQMLFMLCSFLAAAYDVVMETVDEIVNRHQLTMEPLILLASLAAFVVRLEIDGAALMLLYRICSLALTYAASRSEQMLKTAVDQRPEKVTVLEDEGEKVVDRNDVRAGDTVYIRGGSVCAVDCLVAEGEGSMDLAALTGVHAVQSVKEGDVIPAGSKLLSGEITGEAMGPASGSMFERLWNETRSEAENKCTIEHWLELYRRFFVPVALALGAVITVLLNVVSKCSVSNAIHRALCVMILLNPAGLFAGLHACSRAGITGALSRGVLFKGIGSVEKAATPAIVVLDKNGTVTTGKYRVEAVRAEKLDAYTLLKAAAHAAANADTPLAHSVVEAYQDTVDFSIIANFVEYENGLSVEMKGIPVLLGKRSFLQEHGVALPDGEDDPLELHVAFAGRYAGSILMGEMPRVTVADTVAELQELGCNDVLLLSEDSSEKTHGLARLCGIDNYYSNCTAPEKLTRVTELTERSGKASTVYVGAGACDTECLNTADLGVVLGDLDSPCGSDADVLLLGGSLDSLCEAVRSARLTRTVFLQGLGAVLGVKLLLILLALFGVSSQLWFDALLDGVVAIAAVLNAVRALPVTKE